MQSEVSPSVSLSSVPIPVTLPFQEIVSRLDIRKDPMGETPASVLPNWCMSTQSDNVHPRVDVMICSTFSGQAPPPPLGNPPAMFSREQANKEGEWRKAWSPEGHPFWWNTACLGGDGFPIRSWIPPQLSCPTHDSAAISSIVSGVSTSVRASSTAPSGAIPGDLLVQATHAMKKNQHLLTRTGSFSTCENMLSPLL